MKQLSLQEHACVENSVGFVGFSSPLSVVETIMPEYFMIYLFCGNYIDIVVLLNVLQDTVGYFNMLYTVRLF